MEFSPKNNIVKLCLQGIALEEQGKPEEAKDLFMKASKEATNDFEMFLSAFYVARQQKSVVEKLNWFEKSLHHALAINDETVKSAYATLYSNIAKCYEELENREKAKHNYELADSYKDQIFDQGPFYHGTKAGLKVGDLLVAGNRSNYQQDIIMNHIYFTAMVNGAGLAAALAKGDGLQRVYIVEPAGSFENDPNVTDKKFPGNLTRSYRTSSPLKIVGEVVDWAKQSKEDIKKWQEKLDNNKGEIIN